MDAIFLAHQHVKALHCVVGKKKIHVDHVSCSVQCFWLSTLVECFSVLDNIILAVEPNKMGFLQKKEARAKVLELSEKYGLKVDPDALIEDISVGMQQRVEILKMLYRENEILIFDEPTAVLTPQEIDELMEITVKLDIPVIAYGLRLNFRQDDKGFEGATRLLQIAQDIEELKTICECGRKATVNTRILNGKIVTDGPDILIDDGTTEVEYRAFCQTCFHKYKNKK